MRRHAVLGPVEIYPQPLPADQYVPVADANSDFANHSAANSILNAGLANPATAATAIEAARLQAQAGVATKAAEAATLVHNIETRRLTPEVSRLNDIAQSEIWGTGGRTTGLVDPITGQPLTQPIKGLIESIREQEFEGTRRLSTDERNKRAQNKETEIKGLVADGFELCQAKLAIDLRKEDEASYAKLIAKHIADGMNAANAEARAKKTYDSKDAKRLDIIKSKGIFTADEYAEAIKSKSKEKISDDDETKKLEQVLQESERQRLVGELASARTDYARRLAGHSTGAYRHSEEFNADAVAAAKYRYEQTRGQLTAVELRQLQRAGLTGEDILNTAENAAGLINSSHLVTEIDNQQKLASGKYEELRDPAGHVIRDRRSGIVELVRKQPNSKVGQIFSWPIERLDGFFGRRAGARFRTRAGLERTAATIVTAAGIGTAAALTGSILIGPVFGLAAAGVGGAAAMRIARTMWGARVSRNGAMARADQRWNDYRQFVDNVAEHAHRMAAPGQTAVSGMYSIPEASQHAHTVEGISHDDVRNNKIRLGLAAGTLAAGSLLTFGVEHLLGVGDGTDHVVKQIKPHGTRANTGTLPPSLTSRPPKGTLAVKTGATGGNGGIHTVTPNEVSDQYVATVYENAEGLRPGLSDMEHAANLAHAAHELNTIYPDPGNPNEFFYQTADGHQDTESILKVLAKYGSKLRVS